MDVEDVIDRVRHRQLSSLPLARGFVVPVDRATRVRSRLGEGRDAVELDSRIGRARICRRVDDAGVVGSRAGALDAKLGRPGRACEKQQGGNRADRRRSTDSQASPPVPRTRLIQETRTTLRPQPATSLAMNKPVPLLALLRPALYRVPTS